MFRRAFAVPTAARRFPRIRGDVPPRIFSTGHTRQFSPHTRGCSGVHGFDPRPSMVFPAYAGMFLDIADIGGGSRPFSPHTRGCSAYLVAVPRYGEVFPAYAGMFRLCAYHLDGIVGFPRIRGDVPTGFWMKCLGSRFSPHTRGCSPDPAPAATPPRVFPAYAGMFRPSRHCPRNIPSFPRIRGDVEVGKGWSEAITQFSPHTRGCSLDVARIHVGITVFPAYAGMFPCLVTGGFVVFSFPRIRGDVPSQEGVRGWRVQFSPHTRGCSWWQHARHRAMVVFPAYAGMFRLSSWTVTFSAGFPRIRGDVPRGRMCSFWLKRFSPHTRGCSDAGKIGAHVTGVFPAYAGMFPSSAGAGAGSCCFLRIRGDVPYSGPHPFFTKEFSPHTRGCSAGLGIAVTAAIGFPRIRGDVPRGAARSLSSC